MKTIRISSTEHPLENSSFKADVFREINGNEGENLLEIIRKGNFPGFQAPCGGSGTCGKCRIKILTGNVTPATAEEKRILSEEERFAGIRLACRTHPAESAESGEYLHILIQETEGSRVSTSARLSDSGMTTGNFRYQLHEPRIPEPSLEDQRSILGRLEITEKEDHISVTAGDLPVSALRRLGRTSTENDSATSDRLLTENGKLIDVIDKNEKVLGFAVDIGTTTVVVHLLDLITGEELGLWSGLNAQRSRGADVISRINYSMESPEKLDELKNLIVSQLNRAMEELLEEKGLGKNLVRNIAVAGNTTMLHLLLGVDSSGIAAAPFIPVFLKNITVPAGEAGFTLPRAQLELLPSVSAYVGADITAGMGVTAIDSFDEPVLFIDIGTNGEMALAHEGRILSCSTAAGPAFEGANISRGTGGIPGAIDKAVLENGNLRWTTIDALDPIGICGSGIIDTAALLVESGAAEYTGRILSQQECGFDWITDSDEGSAIQFPETSILFTQKDLREVQLAKAAVAGGARTLIKAAGLEITDIGKVILAGGFGSYIDPASAGRIGLLPGNLSSITEAAGNTSGAGAIRTLLTEGMEEKFSAIAASCEYIELSSNPDFQNFYIDEMCFPEIVKAK